MGKLTAEERCRKAQQDPNQTQLSGQRYFQKYLNAWERVAANEKLHQMRKVRQDSQRRQQEVQATPKDDPEQISKEAKS